jgi:dTDP-glucose 4,6-dehydratase
MSNYSAPVNIGNPDEITILDFAKEIIKLTNTTQKIVFKELPQDDPKQRRPDITLAQQLLNWEPKVHRSEGLRITYDYFKGLTADELNKVEHKDFDKYNRK